MLLEASCTFQCLLVSVHQSRALVAENKDKRTPKHNNIMGADILSNVFLLTLFTFYFVGILAILIGARRDWGKWVWNHTLGYPINIIIGLWQEGQRTQTEERRRRNQVSPSIESFEAVVPRSPPTVYQDRQWHPTLYIHGLTTSEISHEYKSPMDEIEESKGHQCRQICFSAVHLSSIRIMTTTSVTVKLATVLGIVLAVVVSSAVFAYIWIRNRLSQQRTRWPQRLLDSGDDSDDNMYIPWGHSERRLSCRSKLYGSIPIRLDISQDQVREPPRTVKRPSSDESLGERYMFE
ncbi:uncharacterized protein EI90DRAFT_3022890 [Cantharellus anzutake]|uniref:uncharacterized protein n=1 Tax=Cantharellus anzutake TaxID=1750568 RepID=UPI001904C8FE|nr:uncharacterized protein EI90DRAFT_3022890 [Cantharellus anzutake]KAF8312752.1 hypothetical protein EI90DRAFT_3022890 [Cantharellus anzutake]